jgi:ABC-type oligopeptide transport system ATPase subunit
MDAEVGKFIAQNVQRIRQEKIQKLFEELEKMETIVEPKKYHLDISTIQTLEDVKQILDGLDLTITDNALEYNKLKKYFPIEVE